ncbi:MAG: ferric reductase-like transmembrane domain-containing protein [Melioribacteraceae bacterium]
MLEKIKQYNLIWIIVFLVGVPLFIWATGEVHQKAFYKEAISVVTILAFFFLIGQSYLTRGYRVFIQKLKMSRLLKLHKIFGYVFVSVIVLHPLYIVLPKFFDNGITPYDAFITMLTTFESTGIILGIVSWILLVTLAITSIIRSRLFKNYRTWRVFHAILALFFVTFSTWHVLNLGRHSTTLMAIYMILVSIGGVFIMMKVYYKTLNKVKEEE